MTAPEHDGPVGEVETKASDAEREVLRRFLSGEVVPGHTDFEAALWGACTAMLMLRAQQRPDVAERETRRADAAERDLAHIVGRAQHHLDRANAAEAREAALRALLTDEPLIVHAIRRDLERTPDGRGGDLSVKPGTPGWGKSGCPGDNLTRWLDDRRALLDGEVRP